MITIKKLNKSYKKNHVLKDITATISGPGIVALLGPNGSGKTTLLKCFLGMVLPDSGDILFKGKSTLNEYLYRNDVSYLSVTNLIATLNSKGELRFEGSKVVDLISLDDSLSASLLKI